MGQNFTFLGLTQKLVQKLISMGQKLKFQRGSRLCTKEINVLRILIKKKSPIKFKQTMDMNEFKDSILA